jgi:hypothetical protein
VVLLIAV